MQGEAMLFREGDATIACMCTISLTADDVLEAILLAIARVTVLSLTSQWHQACYLIMHARFVENLVFGSYRLPIRSILVLFGSYLPAAG
jgi:hypothetical protein